MNRSSKAALVGATAIVSVLALAGCAAGTGAAAAPTPTPTVTVTSTVTATPAPASASPDDPMDALTAWTACVVLAQEVYVSQAPNAKMAPYNPKTPPTKNADGTWRAIVGFPLDPPTEGAGSVVVICDIGGTKGAPTLVHWSTKDI